MTNLFNKKEKIKSNPPKKTATTAEAPITIKVYLTVSFRVGQLTFFNSNLTSLRKETIFNNLFLILGFMVYLKSPVGLHLDNNKMKFVCQIFFILTSKAGKIGKLQPLWY